MSNRPNRRKARRARPSSTRQPQPIGRPIPGRPFVAPLPITEIRAGAAAKAQHHAGLGVRHQDAETILRLCDYITARLPWRQLELRNEQRRHARRDRWQRRPSLREVGLEWADLHRAEILEHWNATQRRAPIEGAGVWIIPDPGQVGEFVRSNCPHCTFNGVARGCDRCDHRGTLMLPKGT